MAKKDSICIETNDKRIMEALKEVGNKAKKPKKLMRIASQIMLEDVDSNFDTQGKNADESWQDWFDPYKIWREKNNRGGGELLVLEGEMREGVGRKVTETTAKVYSDKEYAAIHNFGFDDKITKHMKKSGKSFDVDMHIPKKTFMKWHEDLKQNILDELMAELYVNEKYNESFL